MLPVKKKKQHPAGLLLRICSILLETLNLHVVNLTEQSANVCFFLCVYSTRIHAYLHDERRACGNIGLLRLQLSVGVVEAVPGGAHHVDHVSVHHREIREAMRGDAQHAEVVVQRRRAVFDLDALFFVIHGDAFMSPIDWCRTRKVTLVLQLKTRRIGVTGFAPLSDCMSHPDITLAASYVLARR